MDVDSRSHIWLWMVMTHPHMLAMSDLLGAVPALKLLAVTANWLARPFSTPWRGKRGDHKRRPTQMRNGTHSEIMALCGLTFIGNAIVFHVNP